jgi:hypothetical protein
LRGNYGGSSKQQDRWRYTGGKDALVLARIHNDR